MSLSLYLDVCLDVRKAILMSARISASGCLDVIVSVCLPLWMFVCLDVYQSGSLDICMSVWIFFCMSVFWRFWCRSGCLNVSVWLDVSCCLGTVWMSIFLDFWMYWCLSGCLYGYLDVSMSALLQVCLSVCLKILMSGCFSVCLSWSLDVCLDVCLDNCLNVSLGVCMSVSELSPLLIIGRFFRDRKFGLNPYDFLQKFRRHPLLCLMSEVPVGRWEIVQTKYPVFKSNFSSKLDGQEIFQFQTRQDDKLHDSMSCLNLGLFLVWRQVWTYCCGT